MADIIERRADDWELRCRFNRGRYFERLQAGEFKTQTKIQKPNKKSMQPAGTQSHIVLYFDPVTNEEIAKVHQYVLPDGSLGGHGLPDPKHLKVGDIRFKQKEGPVEKKDPSLFFPEGSVWRVRYKNFRRACCRHFGPNIDRMIAILTTPLIRCLIVCGLVG
jgi:hypothetical protein